MQKQKQHQSGNLAQEGELLFTKIKSKSILWMIQREKKQVQFFVY